MRLFAVVVFSLCTSLSHAQAPVAGDPWDAPIAIEAQVAPFGPVGGVGAALEYAPSRYLALRAGAGVSFVGWRAGVGVHGRWPFRPRVALGLDVWYSLGPDTEPLNRWHHQGTVQSWDLSHQVRLGLTFEYRSTGGFLVRPFIGAAVLVAESGFSCDALTCDAHAPTRRALPYLGLALGYAIVP